MLIALRIAVTLLIASAVTWGLLWLFGVQDRWVLALVSSLVVSAAGAFAAWMMKTPTPAESSQRDLLTFVSRDIHAQLQAIVDILASMDDPQVLPREQRARFTALHVTTASLQDLLSSVLASSKVDVGHLELNPHFFALRELLEQVFASAPVRQACVGLKTSFHVQSRVPDTVEADAERLCQVLETMLRRAASSIDDGTLTLRVSLRGRQENEIEILLAIQIAGEDVDTTRLDAVVQAKDGYDTPDDDHAEAITLRLAVQLIELLGGEVITLHDGRHHTLAFSCRLGVRDEGASPPTERTQLGLIPDLPVLVMDADAAAAKETEDLLIGWQTSPRVVHSAEAMFKQLAQRQRERDPYGLIILSSQAPGTTGFALCEQVKQDQVLSTTPIILLTSPTRPEEAELAIRAGATTSLPRPVKASQLARAIVTAVLGQGRYQQLRKDLGAAEFYVRSLIPRPTTDPLWIDWRYVPTAELAGDVLGFHWIDQYRCAFYVIDVSGHGIDAALLSVSVLNVMKSMSLPDTDFCNPGQVLARLNDKFPMETQGDRFFSAWYGVYDTQSSRLRYASGGHPPAILIEPKGNDRLARPLVSEGPLIGMLPDMNFSSEECNVPHGATIYAFSDGVFEIEQAGGKIWTFDELQAFLQDLAREGGVAAMSPLDAVWSKARSLRGGELDDDFTILELRIPGNEDV